MAAKWGALACCLLIPAVLILCGWLMRDHAPSEINRFFGYRTRRAMQNRETWHFAHQFCGKLWRETGWIMLTPSILIPLLFFWASLAVIWNVAAVLILVQAAVLIATIPVTERALKKTFGDGGTPEDPAKPDKPTE